EKKDSLAELDFLIEEKSEIIPIEVKSEPSTKLKSLIYFMHLHKHKRAVRISLDKYDKEKNFSTKIFDGHQHAQVKFELINIPLYLAKYISYLLLK
ncbi:MAG: hypothetical protein HQK51_18165, partial [Oligoflexia bacterium]|nr:hypothetical protein [Oligoflexia bacterium]